MKSNNRVAAAYVLLNWFKNRGAWELKVYFWWNEINFTSPRFVYSIQNFNPGNMTYKMSYLKILSDEAVRNGWTFVICIFSRSQNNFGTDAEMFNKGNYFDHNIAGDVLFILDQGVKKSWGIHSLASDCFEKKKFGYCRANMRISKSRKIELK